MELIQNSLDSPLLYDSILPQFLCFIKSQVISLLSTSRIFQVPLYIQQNIFWLNMFLHILHPFLDYPRTQLYIPSSIHPSFTDSSIHPSFHPSYLYSEAEFPPIIIEPRTHRIILFLLFHIRLSGFRFLLLLLLRYWFSLLL